ncbi:MAG: hypothetical protein ACUVUU_04895 [bacterium]
MKNKKTIAAIVIPGVLWGFSEIYIGDLFYRFHIPMRAAFLTSIGMTILIVARLLSDRFGSSTGTAVLAGVIRCLIPKAYICHLVAIAFEGFVFDVTWTAIKAGRERSMRKIWLTSVTASYLGSLAFVLLSTYFFKFGKWVNGGLLGGVGWVLKTGGVAAIVLCGLVPVAKSVANRIGVIVGPEILKDTVINRSKAD